MRSRSMTKVVVDAVRNLVAAMAIALVVPAAQAPDAPQASSGVQWLHIDGSSAIAVGVLWPHGYDDGNRKVAGIAHVLAACRLANAKRGSARLLASGVKVGSDYSLAFGVVSADDHEGATTFLAALLAPDVAGLADDAVALAIARAALHADDAEFLYPGSVLLRRARQRLAAGTELARPPAGVAAALHQLTVASVRAALAGPGPLRVACLGAIDAELMRTVDALSIANRCEASSGSILSTRSRGRAALSKDLHSRADSPYVSAVFPGPTPVDRPAFALAMEVARSRAFRRWRFRGRELHARAPFVGWSWLAADPFVQFCRRGESKVRLLPGEVAAASVDDEVQATVSELRSLLDDLRAVAPSASELGQARQALHSRLRLPGPGEADVLGSDPATLPGRLQVLLLAAHHDVRVAVLNTLTAEQVHTVLLRVLQPKRASWHALLPHAVREFGYRQR